MKSEASFKLPGSGVERSPARALIYLWARLSVPRVVVVSRKDEEERGEVGR